MVDFFLLLLLLLSYKWFYIEWFQFWISFQYWEISHPTRYCLTVFQLNYNLGFLCLKGFYRDIFFQPKSDFNFGDFHLFHFFVRSFFIQFNFLLSTICERFILLERHSNLNPCMLFLFHMFHWATLQQDQFCTYAFNIGAFKYEIQIFIFHLLFFNKNFLVKLNLYLMTH